MNAAKILIIALAIVLSSLSTSAQTVVITGRKQVYTRSKPEIDFKKSFSIRRPVVRASTPALSKKITALVDPATVLKINIREELTDFQWLSEADFKVVYNKRGILTMMVWMEGSGAYPDGVTDYVVIDIAKGRQLIPDDVFDDLQGLARVVKKKQDTAVAEAIKVIKADKDFGGEDPKSLFETTNFEATDLEGFSVNSGGVSFYYNYGFPHVIKALEPDRELRLSWAEIKPFIRKDGLLARFVP